MRVIKLTWTNGATVYLAVDKIASINKISPNGSQVCMLGDSSYTVKESVKEILDTLEAAIVEV